MKNFIFKSTDADLQKMFQYLERMSANILYITHQVDFIRKQVIGLEADKGLQKQVDEYFDEANRATAGLVPEDFKEDND